MEPAKIRGQTLEHTYVLDEDVLGEPQLASLKCDYSLCEADFLRIKTRNTGFLELSIAMLLISIGYGISIGAKYLARRFDGGTTPVETWEYWGATIGFLVAIFLYLCALIFPGERHKVMKEMETHFRNHPRQRKIVRQKNVP